MRLSSFNSQLVSLKLTGGQEAGIPAILTVERQCRAHWCWAAVALSVGKHFGVTDYQTQEDLVFNYFNFTVEEKLSNSAACDSNDNQHGDHTSLIIPLSSVGFPNAASKEAPLQEEELVHELSNGRPVCAFIEWSNGTGYHAIAIVGIEAMRDQDGNRRYIIGDPLHNTQRSSYNQLCDSYYNNGQWKVTFTLS
ncbi:papain-like cysteine protease family protein [Methylomonas sp. 11b]|uniref:papain-like cysteine protease family protein n=1 Tax=Methylomonas sp. 11b TaxID=1168169 RepID=UPI00047951CB|nr:papain-like cysteine protease family protein [Methylomonas sp. 11b]